MIFGGTWAAYLYFHDALHHECSAKDNYWGQTCDYFLLLVVSIYFVSVSLLRDSHLGATTFFAYFEGIQSESKFRVKLSLLEISGRVQFPISHLHSRPLLYATSPLSSRIHSPLPHSSLFLFWLTQNIFSENKIVPSSPSYTFQRTTSPLLPCSTLKAPSSF